MVVTESAFGRVVYDALTEDGRGVWMQVASGATPERVLTRGNNPVLASDGHTLVFTDKM